MNISLFFCILSLITALFISSPAQASADHQDDDHAHTEAEPAKGPQGGRLLSQGDFALEVTIYETGVEPELRLYGYQKGKAIQAEALKVEVKLQRLGETAELIRFSPELNYLLGDAMIREPHSFEVLIHASYQGKNYEWHYDSFEGRTQLSERSIKKAGIALDYTQPGKIQTQLHLFGVVAAVPEQQYQVGAAYAGVLQQLAVKVGDKVSKGQLLARVQNPASLKNYAIYAPAAGEITASYVSVGAKVSEQPLVEISDFSSVYVEMSAFPSDTEQMKTGDRFLVKDLHGHQSAVSQISYIAPQMTGGHIARARGVLANPDGFWRPGMHVKTDVTVATVDAPLVIKKSALQLWNGKTVIFIKVGDQFEIRMPQLGRADDTQVEVLSGVPLGVQYATENSFILKADVMKSGASHDH